jgi:hypothetical protein
LPRASSLLPAHAQPRAPSSAMKPRSNLPVHRTVAAIK